jgi:dTDP-4-amino-4,6-dideoxygalactose transaminase
MMRDWGQETKYHHVVKGFNYRMEGFQGAILGVKLKHLEQWTETRRAHARRYKELLEAISIECPQEAPDTRHVFHVYAIRISERERLQQQLQAAGIGTAIHYPIPVHLQKSFAHLGYKAGDFPVSEGLANTVLSLPMYPEMTETHISEVIEALRKTVASAEAKTYAHSG